MYLKKLNNKNFAYQRQLANYNKINKNNINIFILNSHSVCVMRSMKYKTIQSQCKFIPLNGIGPVAE